MSNKPNAIYIMGGGGTQVISASGYGAVQKAFSQYRDKIGTFYVAVGGMRGALNEDWCDIFAWALEDGEDKAQSRLNRIKWYSAPVFGTSRHKPDSKDSERLLELLKAHNVKYVFLNGGNDTMEKAMILQEYSEKEGFPLTVVGVPKTVDNDLLVTHRCPGYASFAKQVAMNTMSVQADLDSFALPEGAVKDGPIKEGAVAQVLVLMGRDEGWGAAAAVAAKIDESYGPHVILTKEGGFDPDKFIARCQEAYDKYGRLLVVAAEGAHDGENYIGNYLQVASKEFDVQFQLHQDAHKNTSVTDSRLGLFLKLLIEAKLNIPTYYKGLKVREEGPGYINRSHVEVVSAVDIQDAINVGAKAVELAIGEGKGKVMPILTDKVGDVSYTELCNVADTEKGSRGMTRSLSTLSKDGKSIISEDGMMIDKDLFMEYIGPFMNLNGPNRIELFREEGMKYPLERINFPLIDRKLPAYKK